MHQKCNEKLQQKNAAVWGISSAGRASALHAEGQRFDPAMLHHLEINGSMSSSVGETKN